MASAEAFPPLARRRDRRGRGNLLSHPHRTSCTCEADCVDSSHILLVPSSCSSSSRQVSSTQVICWKTALLGVASRVTLSITWRHVLAGHARKHAEEGSAFGATPHSCHASPKTPVPVSLLALCHRRGAAESCDGSFAYCNLLRPSKRGQCQHVLGRLQVFFLPDIVPRSSSPR